MDRPGALDVGRRLMPQVIDRMAVESPHKVVCVMPRNSDHTHGYIPLNFEQLAHAVNYMSWWIEDTFGSRKGSSMEALVYLGANDVRYLVMVMACNKTAYEPLLLSTRNSQAAQSRLLEVTGCTRVAFSTERRFNAEEIEAVAPNILSKEIPSLEEMIHRETTGYIFAKDFREVKDEVAFIAHSSGTTGFPKPIRLTYGYFGALDHGAHVPIPPGRTAGVPDRLSSDDLIMATTPFFHLMGFSLLIMAVFHGIPCVILPDRPLSTTLLTSVLRDTQPTAALFPPCILEDMLNSPESMDALAALKRVYFGGGPLSPDIGRRVSERVPLISFLGMTEGGFVLSLVPLDRYDWNYFEWSETFGIQMVLVGDGLFEMTIHRTARPDLQPIFHTFPDQEVYHTNDLYIPHPTKANLWKFHGRHDDVIVFSNGEKFNPVTMEKMVEGHPLVARAIVVGKGKFQTALLLEPSRLYWDGPELTLDSFIEKVWPVIQNANRISPSHGRVMKNRITVASRSKPFSTTPKGSTQRRLVAHDYQNEIESVYTRPACQDYPHPVPADLVGITVFVRTVVSDCLGVSGFTDETDFYTVGFDSLQTMHVSAVLQRAGYQIATPQMIYGHPTVESLSSMLSSAPPGSSHHTISRHHRIEALVNKYTMGLSAPIDYKHKMCTPGKHVVLLTGSTGSLGSYLLNDLLHDNTVTTVYCLNRSSDAPGKQVESFRQKGLNTAALCRVKFLQCSLSDKGLGIPAASYAEMIRSVDIVIHNAWQMNFNLSLDSFEGQVRGFRYLIDFGLQCGRPARVYFMSSIGAVGNWKAARGDLVPEIAIDDAQVPLRSGYGEAKHVCERLCQAASQRAGLPTTILRLGQIAGPMSEAGMWNPSEWLPAMVATSKTMGKAPSTLGTAPMNWIPVDQLSTIILEIINTGFSSGSAPQKSHCRVFHVSNPQDTAWEPLCTSICQHYGIHPIELRQWITDLEKKSPSAAEIASKPAVKLLDFYRGLADGAGTLAVPMSIRHAQAASPTLRSLGPITPAMMINWLNQWNF